MSNPVVGPWSDPLYARAQTDMTKAMQAFMEDALISPPTLGRRYQIAETILGTMYAIVEDCPDGRRVRYEIDQLLPAGYLGEEAAGADGES